MRAGRKAATDFKAENSTARADRAAILAARKAAMASPQREMHLPTEKQTTFDQSSRLAANHPTDKQRLNEERKLEHRRKIANHLRDLSAQNGNENLTDVADRLDQKAQEHYDKRIARLGERVGSVEGADAALSGDPEGDVLPSAEDALNDASGALNDLAATEDAISDSAQKLTGRENALYRQLRNEERKLDQGMATVERLNQLYEQTGDPQYLDAAERLESMALAHYEERLARITEFQDRFNLPTTLENAP
jgi:hypothetical protein